MRKTNSFDQERHECAYKEARVSGERNPSFQTTFLSEEEATVNNRHSTVKTHSDPLSEHCYLQALSPPVKC